MFALSRTGMLRSYIESYEVADLLREVRKCKSRSRDGLEDSLFLAFVEYS